MNTDVRQALEDRLLRLGEALNLQATPRLGEFLSRFQPYLNHFMEFGVVYDGPSVAALSFGHGEPFHATLLDYMGEQGFSEQDREQVRALRRDVDDWMVIKADVIGGQKTRLGVYFRRAMPLPDVRRHLRGFGVSDEDALVVDHVAARLGTTASQIFAVGVGDGGPPEIKVYLNVGIREQSQVQERLFGVFDRVAVPHAPYDAYLARHQELTDSLCSGMFVSLFFRGGRVERRVKLDYFCVPVAALQKVLDVSGLAPPAMPGPLALGEAVELTRAEHFGIHFSADNPQPSMSLYFPFVR